MRKNYILLLLALCFACSTDSNELKNPDSENEINAFSKSSNSMWELQTDLIKLYTTNNYYPILLSDKISLLDSLSNNLSEFVILKTPQYTLISTNEVDDIIINYNQLYQDLNQTPKFLKILDIIILTEFDLNNIGIEINNEDSLSEDEKELLLFIAYNSNDKWDINWKKRRGISIIQGYNQSKANAIFNAALFSILY